MALVLVVLGLYLLFGVALQLALGEAGLILAQLGCLFLPAVLFVRLRGFDFVQTFSLRAPTVRQTLGGVLVLVGGIQVAWFLAWLQSFLLPVPVELLDAMSEMLTADSLARFLWLLTLAAVVPAVAEETLFRGVVLSGFRNRLPTVWAVIGAGVVFGLFHLSPQTAFRFLPTAWLGVLLAWVVVSSGSLPLAVLLHFLNNAAIVTIASLPITADRLTDPDQGPPLVLLPVAVLALWWGLPMLRSAGRGETGPERGLEPGSSN